MSCYAISACISEEKQRGNSEETARKQVRHRAVPQAPACSYSPGQKDAESSLAPEKAVATVVRARCTHHQDLDSFNLNGFHVAFKAIQ